MPKLFQIATTAQDLLEGPTMAAAVTGTVSVQKTAADAQASDATLLAVGGIGRLPSGVSHTIAKVCFIPSAALTHNASHYATINVYRMTLGSASEGQKVATLSTAVGDWAALIPVTLTVDTTLATYTAADNTGTVLAFEITKTGNGVVVPAGILVVEYTLL